MYFSRRLRFGLVIIMVAPIIVFLSFLFPPEKEEIHQNFQFEVYFFLDKLFKDVNSLEKIQKAISLMIPSWLVMCYPAPEDTGQTCRRKQRINYKIQDTLYKYRNESNHSIEDCIIAYYNSEIVLAKDNFHQMLFEMVLQGYVKMFNRDLNPSVKFLQMETISCSGAQNCQYYFPKPSLTSSKMFLKIVNRGSSDSEAREKICSNIFQYLQLWNEKTINPKVFEVAYYLLFSGMEKALNVSEMYIKQHVNCSSVKVREMEKEIITNPEGVNEALVTFLRERNFEFNILKEEKKNTLYKSVAAEIYDRMKVQGLLIELVLKTYSELFNISPDSSTISYTSRNGNLTVDLPPMHHISLL